MKYRKKPVVIEAQQFNGPGDYDNILKWIRESAKDRGFPIVLRNDQLLIETLEGTMIANAGTWIIVGVKGEVYPCKPDIFEATYDLAE